jgi:ABC-type multidrug transport system ATPase subunit/pSer/pThr/pTyr-binding forkhead associated (FHA) protein
VTTALGERSFSAGTVVIIGRDPSAAIVIDHPLVSRRHAELRAGPDGWSLRDLGSRNGTFVAGRQIELVDLSGVVAAHLGDAATGPALTIAVDGASTPDPPVAAVVSAPRIGPPTEIHRPARAMLRIGRDEDNDVVVADLLVSRHHAEVRPDADGRWVISDLGSHNGTYVNGRPVREAALEELDVVGIGREIFRVVAGTLERHADTGDVSIEASGLTVRTPTGTVLLDRVGFTLHDRTFLAVVGPSGAGKSTLINAVTGFRPAVEGSVRYNGRDLYAGYEDLRRRIGLVPQDDVVHTQLTVRDALGFAAELRFPPDVSHADRTRRVDEVMAELGLTARADVVIGSLSGGQRKRVSVALELLTRPSLLVLDEPTSGLDPGYERTLMELLRSLADGGRTVIVVTHSVQSLMLCDRVLFLAPGGHTAYFGPPQLALAFFGRDDFQEVFKDLSDSGQDWAARFRAHTDHERFVATAAVPVLPRDVRPAKPPRGPGWFRQVATLTRRYAKVVAGDRRNLLMLLAQAPLLGLLMLVALPPDELGPAPAGEVRLLSRASLVLFIIVLGCTWLGGSNAAREIVKERPLFRRERATGLSVSAYLTSKVLVLGGITAVQAVVLTSIAVARQGGPTDAVVLGWPLGELLVVAVLTGVASMAGGLLLSSAVRSADQAMTILPVLLILHLVLASAGVFPAIAERPGLAQARFASSAQWGFSAAASTADLNHLQPLNDVAQRLPTVSIDRPQEILDALLAGSRGEAEWRHRPGTWTADVVALVAIGLLCLVAAGLVLRRAEAGGI